MTAKTDPEADNVTYRLTAGLCAIYLMAIGWILLFKFGVRFTSTGKRLANLVPFKGASVVTPENILNIVIFIPLGVYMSILCTGWRPGKKLLFIFLCSLLIECLQYLLRIGVFDVTDLITNTAGGLIGLILFKAIEKPFNRKAKVRKTYSIFAVAGTVCIIILLTLLKLSLLPFRYQ